MTLKKDLSQGFKLWRLVHLHGMSLFRARYSRSKLGQLWATIVSFFYILSIGSVWTLIWGVDIDNYLPHVAFGSIIYTLFSTPIVESISLLEGDARMYINDKRPYILSSLACIYRNFIIFLHNLPILIVVLMWSKSRQPIIDLRTFFSILFSFVTVTFFSYGVALVCARFRDLKSIIDTIIQVSFLLTPVMWEIKFLPSKYHIFIYIFNPFASALETLRGPMLGEIVPAEPFYALFMWMIVSYLFALYMHRKLSRGIIFWIQ